MKALLYLTTSLVFISSCKHEPYLTPFECNDTYFVDDIKPLLMKSCGSNTIECHFKETDDNEYIALYSYYDIVNSSNDKLLDFDDLTNCDLYEECEDLDCTGYTYYNTSQDDREKLMEWIENGAKGGYCHNICDEAYPSYQNSIKKLMYNCIGCHYEGNSLIVNLTTYDEVVAAIDSGLYHRISSTGQDMMPPDYPLKECEIELVLRWISGGKKEN